MNRRSFVTRSGLLLGSLGLANTFTTDLMGEISKTLLPTAHADTLAPRRVLELCFRYGIPMIIFGTGTEFTRLSQPRYSNFSYAGNEILKAAGTANLYLNQDSSSLLPHASNIAITQGVLSEGGHTNLFNYRTGGLNKGKTSPVIELANSNPTQSIVSGVQWPGDIENQTNSHQNLNSVNPSGFLGLFKNSKLRMSTEEVQEVLATATKLSRRQALLLENKTKDSLAQFKTYNKAMNLFNTDYSSLLNLSDMPSELTPSGVYAQYRESLGLTLKGFANNLINSAVVPIQLGDWHGYQQNKQLSLIIKNISGMIAATVDYLKRTPDPAAGSGKMLWDTTVIVAGSEFNRGVSQFSKDNNDGGTQGIMLIGKNIRGNYYGGFTLSDRDEESNAGTKGIHPISGELIQGQNTAEQLYYTTKEAMGLPLLTTEKEKVLRPMLG